jgi:hypothetical protein
MRSEWPAVLSAALLAAGCVRTTMERSVAGVHSRVEPTAELDFWDGLALEPAVTNHDALHALALQFSLVEDGADPRFADELEIARRRGWVSPSANLAPNETAPAGWIARAVCIESDIRGGFTMRLVGPLPRYALRELAHLGYLPALSESQTLSGLQLMALLTKAEEHRSGETRAPAEGL